MNRINKRYFIDTKSMMNKKIYLYKYAIYGSLGICLEIFWTGFRSLMNQDYTMEGRTYIWMFFIYGLAVFLEPIHDRIRDQNFILRGFLYMVLIFITEFFTGLLLRTIIGKCPWNYTGNGSINGLITLSFIPLWFGLGLLLEKVHDFLDFLYLIKDKNS